MSDCPHVRKSSALADTISKSRRASPVNSLATRPGSLGTFDASTQATGTGTDTVTIFSATGLAVGVVEHAEIRAKGISPKPAENCRKRAIWRDIEITLSETCTARAAATVTDNLTVRMSKPPLIRNKRIARLALAIRRHIGRC